MYVTKTVGQDLRCGEVFEIPSLKGRGVTLYNPAGSTVAKGVPLIWEVVGPTMAKSDHCITSETSTTIHRILVFPMEDILTLKIGKCQFSGLTKCLVEDTASRSAGRHLEVITTGTYLIDNGASLTVNSVGVLFEAIVSGENSGTEVLKNVYLRGERIHISGS